MKPAPVMTNEEYELIKEFILLPIILDVLERDIKKIDKPNVKMGEVYIRMLKGVQDQILLLMLNNRRQLREHGLKVYEQKRTQTAIEASYLCRGYRHSFSMLWGIVRSEIVLRLCTYLGINIMDEVAP